MALFRSIRRYKLRKWAILVFSAIFLLFLVMKHMHGYRQSLRKFQQLDAPYIFKDSEWSKSWVIFTKPNIGKTGDIFPRNVRPPLTTTSPYLIPNPGICLGSLALTYVVVVHSAPGHFDKRASLRRTWANYTLFKHTHSRTVFVLGRPTDDNLQKDIYEENEKFGDIVQGTFNDHYTNLTLKAVVGLRWITENCRHAKFVIKTDDDVFVNIPEVMTHIFPLLSKNSKELVCLVEAHGPIGRLAGHKWAVSHDYFSGLSEYPMPFCYGFAVFYSVQMAADLFEMAKTTPLYKMDDVYVYGILASKVKGITWRNARPIYIRGDWENQQSFRIFFRIVAVSTASSEEDMQRLWKTFL